MNIIGKRIGKLVVDSRLPDGKILCICDCGASRACRVGHFNTGDIKSCGCHVEEARAHIRLLKCTVDGCDGKRKSLGYCEKHYYRKRRYGTLKTKTELVAEFVERTLGNVTNECVLWPFGRDSGGYGIYGGVRAHRYLLQKHTGENPDGMYAAHGPCHKRLCVNPHEVHGLRWATPRENILDRVRDGTDNRGERHALSVLTENDVRAIRRDSRTPTKIASDYPVSASYIRSIIKGDRWAHVE